MPIKPTSTFTMSKSSVESKFVFNVRIPYIKHYYILIVLNIILVALSLVSKTFLPPEIPLFYGLSSGDAQVTNSNNLVIPSVVSLVIVITNILIANYTKDLFLKKIILATSLFTTIIIFTAIIKILLLVGSIF